MTHRYSVIIPAYNAEKTIEEAIDSVLAQTIKPSEIIVIDDGSNDQTVIKASKYHPMVQVISQVNQGCGGATNTGISHARTSLLSFLDADDVWLTHKMAVQLQTMQDDLSIDGVFSHIQNFKDTDIKRSLSQPYALWVRSTMTIKAEAAKKIGAIIYPPGNRGDMVDWIKRGQELGLNLKMMPHVLASRRIRPDSLSYGFDHEKNKGYLFAIKRALDRKRNPSS